jgi:membrane protein implicated in regulation of membrane protease activity
MAYIPKGVRKIKRLFSGNMLLLALVFLVGGVVENQFRLLSALTANLEGLVYFLTLQVSILWALAFAAAGVALMLLAFRVSRGQKTTTTSRNSRLAGRVGKQERPG